ncbi:MAG: acyloxyacyl hydrolase [Nitrospira sp.]|nr:MAG: acyloxyacyl hydrolase [Nitrospira sp.]
MEYRAISAILSFPVLPSNSYTLIAHFTRNIEGNSAGSLSRDDTALYAMSRGESKLRMIVQATMVGLALFLLASLPVQAEEVRLNSIGVRGGPTGGSPIGDLETQYFKEYDLMANWLLPWGWYSESGWGVGSRLMGSVGAMTASGDTAFVSTVLPGIVLGKKDGWLSLEFGAGGAILSQQHFAHQNVGGLFQLVADMAIRAKVYGGLGVGYWFHHMSDAGLYGEDAHGTDFHMIEVSYRF